MKTIDDAAKSQSYKYIHDNIEYSHPNFVANERFDSFCLGVEFAQRWIPIDEELPQTYKSDIYNINISDFVLIKTDNGNLYKARLYNKIIESSIFNDFYSIDNFIFSNVTHWRPIELE